MFKGEASQVTAWRYDYDRYDPSDYTREILSVDRYEKGLLIQRQNYENRENRYEDCFEYVGNSLVRFDHWEGPISFELDNIGRVVSSTIEGTEFYELNLQFDSAGSLTKGLEITFGNYIQEDYTLGKGKVLAEEPFFYTYTKQNEGGMTLDVFSTVPNMNRLYSFTVDKKGDLRKEERYTVDKSNQAVLQERREYAYNSHGDVIRNDIYCGIPRATKMRYEYDSRGNWIEKWEVDSDIKHERLLEERTIIYN